jgi:tRNA A-37 threonylcarbamoyl transferase component Bud32
MASTHNQILEDAMVSIFGCKFNTTVLKNFLTYEFLFLAGSPKYNLKKINESLKLVLTSVENYFSYPMIFTKCLFQALVTKEKRTFVFLEDYLNGFMTLYTGPVEDRIKLVFKILSVNKDNVVHYQDVECLLQYILIFSKKKKVDLVKGIIDDFFGKKKVLNEDEFINRTIKKNAGIFLIIMSIINEYKTFNVSLLHFLEEGTEPRYGSISPVHKDKFNNTTLMKRNMSKFKNSGNFNASLFQIANEGNTNKEPQPQQCNSPELFKKYYTNILVPNKMEEKITSSNDFLQFIQINYNNEFTFQSQVPSISNYLKTNDESFDSGNEIEVNGTQANNNNNNSNNNAVNTIQTEEAHLREEDMRDLIELSQFESDFRFLRLNCLENVNTMDYAIPKGSNDFILKSGVIELANGSVISIASNASGLNKSFNMSMLNNSFDNGMMPGQNRIASPGKSSFNRSLRLENNQKGSGILQALSGVNNNDKLNNSNLSDLNQSSIIMNANGFFEEEVYLLNKVQKLKKYTLVLLQRFLFVVKKKNDFEIINLENNETQAPDIKMIIPLQKLFIVDAKNVYQTGEALYYVLVLGNTIQFKKRELKLYFDTKNTVISLVNQIIELTNYITVSKEYTYIKDVGKGSFCHMKLMKHNKTNQLYAIKQMNKNVKSLDEFNTQNWEKDIIRFLRNYGKCEHILKFYEIYESYEHLYIVSEFVEGGSLSKYLSKAKTRLTPTSVQKILFHVALGLKELHKFGIIHRDLKLENILMDYVEYENFTAKIIDFGLSKVITPFERTKEPYGTLIYCSPEIMLSFPYNSKVDVWSLGIIAFYLLFAIMPFNVKGKESDQEISNKIIMNVLKIPKLSEDQLTQRELNSFSNLVDMIRRSLKKDIDSRPLINEIEGLLSSGMK